MSTGHKVAERGLGKNRIEALADGIFAVAMTLLVLDIKSPEQRFFATNQALLDYLLTLEHSFAMYAISFFVLGIYWIAHHVLFHFIGEMDRRLLWMNLVFLLLVTVVPFSTDLIGDHGHLILPVIVYGTNLLLLGMLLAGHVAYLGAHPELATSELTGQVAEFMQHELRLYALVPVLSMAVGLYHPRLGMYVYLLLVVPAFRSSRVGHAARGRAQREGE